MESDPGKARQLPDEVKENHLMSVLLVIEASPRFEHSISRRLIARFIEHWSAAHPGGRIVRRDLMKSRLPFLDQAWIDGSRMPAERRSPAMKEAIKVSDELIAELMAADHIVIGTPMYHFAIPAVLKAYIDQIVRVGVTVTAGGFEGMVHGKQATVILASGKDYTAGTDWEWRNCASTYLEQILAFIGITDASVVLAGGTLAVDFGQTTASEVAARLELQLCAAASRRAYRVGLVPLHC
jgi:FMN-dependent NADH-azoreductase